MPSNNVQELADFCRERAGGTLRAVFRYTEDGGDVVYAREDVEAAYRDGFERLRSAAWEVHQTVLAQAPKVRTLGEYRVTVHTFEEAFVMQFRETDEAGTAIVFDREIGRSLHEFLLECEDYLE